MRIFKNPDVLPEYHDSRFDNPHAQAVRNYHASFPEYLPTPLVSLNCLAKELDVAGIHIKDESKRFGLNAFKVLGSSYAIGCFVSGLLRDSIGNMPYSRLINDEIRQLIGQATFITATDGNHGRGVAWTANRLGQNSVVYMPRGTAKERLDNILNLGSDASITDLVYDDCVRKARDAASKNGWILVQDTAWEGYEEIPLSIMQGYLTMVSEALEQLEEVQPTHVFLQAGVGSMAAAAAAYLCSCLERKPVITIVEPDTADCFYRTACAHDGGLHCCDGEMNTIMAGLACGEPNPLAWDILSRTADFFVTIPDEVTEEAMRQLNAPVLSDSRILSGESGASSFGCAYRILSSPNSADLREQFRIGKDSVIFCISTEGPTDTASFLKICGTNA